MNAEQYTVERMLAKRSSKHVNYELDQEYIPIPGTSVRVLLEFPQYSKEGKSAILMLDDAVTVAFSTYRVKAPVITLGNTSVVGFGLGTRIVAGTINRSIFTTDKLTELQSKIFLEEQERIAMRLTASADQIPSGAPLKDIEPIVLDDLTYFNIHMYSISEAIGTTGKLTAPKERFDTIVGATIMNNGQVYSVEDLITEGTMSFQAKGLKSAINITDYTRGYSSNPAYKTISELMKGKKR